MQNKALSFVNWQLDKDVKFWSSVPYIVALMQ